MAELGTIGILDLAARTHTRAAKLNAPSFFAFGRERRFVATIDEFTDALRGLSMQDAQAMTAEDRQRLGTSINAIVEDTERFVARRGGSRREAERNQHLVSRIYALRAAFEALSEGRAPQYVEMRREMAGGPMPPAR